MILNPECNTLLEYYTPLLVGYNDSISGLFEHNTPFLEKNWKIIIFFHQTDFCDAHSDLPATSGLLYLRKASK